MTFIEVNFLVFLIAAVAVFYICPVKHRWLVLLGASIVFYGIAGVEYFPFIFLTSFSVYLGGRKMGQIYEKADLDIAQGDYDRKQKKALKEAAKANCKKVLLGLLILNIGVLCITKFTKFFVNPINSLLAVLGGEGTFSAAMIIVPLGISYYTFSSLSYLLDVYWKRVDYEKDYLRFLLYAIYFPHILQGPIARYGRLGQRLKETLVFDYDRVCKGLQLMLWGFFKKLVIADRINIFTSGLYSDYQEAAGAMFVVAFFLDIVYIYSDFSGCMDIARGVSQIFGVELDLNFDHPFSAKSIPEFWRKWHMSLGGWFRDYVYMPLSTSKMVKNLGKSCKQKNLPDAATRSIITVIPVFTTWMLTGIWHGTGKTYVAWGLYYSTLIFLSIMFSDSLQKLTVKLRINTETWAWGAFQTVRTMILFGGGRWLTRPGTLWRSAYCFKRVFTDFNPWALFDGTLYTYGLDQKGFSLLFICLLIFGLVSTLQMKGSVRDMIAKQNFVFRWMIYILAVMAVVIFGIYGPGFDAAAFVYMAY